MSMVSTHPQLSLIGPTASAEEAAAIVAALEQFMRATVPRSGPTTAEAHEAARWQRAAILEGVSRDPWAEAPDPWINP
jgi:hypothetical protein